MNENLAGFKHMVVRKEVILKYRIAVWACWLKHQSSALPESVINNRFRIKEERLALRVARTSLKLQLLGEKNFVLPTRLSSFFIAAPDHGRWCSLVNPKLSFSCWPLLSGHPGTALAHTLRHTHIIMAHSHTRTHAHVRKPTQTLDKAHTETIATFFLSRRFHTNALLC